MKILIIDNNDSFTYNLKHYINLFADKVDVIRYNKININDINYYDKILFSPGPGLPREYPVLNDILLKYETKKPILGVCLGHQLIAEYYGASLDNLLTPMHGVSSKITHKYNCSLYKNLPLKFKIGHYHSWVVSKTNFPLNIEITALNESNLIMSFKHKIFDVKGIQFHPESILSEYGKNLIKNWVFS